MTMAGSPPSGPSPSRRSRPRIGRWLLPGAAALLLAGGTVAVLVAFDVGGIRGTAPPGPPTRTDEPAVVTPETKSPLEPETRRVAGRFILTAVARRELDEAWSLAAPQLRGGLTLEQWRTGSIPVVPYPVDDIKPVRLSVTRSTSSEASIRVYLDPKRPGKVKPQIFIMQLRKIGGRWLVAAWVPYNAIAIPRGTSS